MRVFPSHLHDSIHVFTGSLPHSHCISIGRFRDFLLPTPTGENNSGPYPEGGALYALGLINSGRRTDVLGYLKDLVKDTSSEVVQHSAVLGLGVAGMASGNAGRSLVSCAVVCLLMKHCLHS